MTASFSVSVSLYVSFILIFSSHFIDVNLLAVDLYWSRIIFNSFGNSFYSGKWKPDSCLPNYDFMLNDIEAMITFLITMVNCGQLWDGTIVHQGWPSLCEMAPLSTMVGHSFVKWCHCQPWLIMLLWNGTTVNHGWPYFCEMAPLLTMVEHAFVKWHQCQPWLTMLLWNGTTINHGWPCFCEMAPLSTMVDDGNDDYGWSWSAHG